MQAAQDALARAVAEFEGPQQSRSIVAFDEVIARLEAVGPRALPPRGRDILVQAYEYRGRAYFGIGLSEKASENFRQLVQLKPDHTLSKERVSPKVVELFNSVKRALVGYLAVSSKPAGAQVTLVGAGGTRTDLGLTDFFPLEVLAGEYTVEIARPGYQTETRPVSITARDTQPLDVPLVRVLASVFFVTEPAGVEIWIDGELKATTSGSLAPELHEEARARGIDPARASARTEVANLSLASHALELRRKCYETVRRTLDTTQPQDYFADPVKMEDSLASLRLTSDPPGARILLNGEARGVTPAQIDGICSGKVRVEVKHAAGKFIKDLVLGKDEAISLDCPIRPTLAFLGVEAASAPGQQHVADAEEKIQQNLSRLTSLNFIAAPREAVDRLLEQDKLTRKALLPGSGTDRDLVRKATARLASALEVQGFLVAVLPEERLQRTARLHLLAAGNTTAEAMDVTFGEGASYTGVLQRLDARFASERPWSGLVTVDTLLHDGVPVLRIVPGSPAAQAGFQPGDVVLGVDGQPVKRTADLIAAVSREEAGGQGGPAGARGRRRLLAARGRPRAGHERARGASLRPAARLQQDDDGPARGGRGIPRHRAGGLRLAQSRPLRHALLRLRRRPRLPAKGEGGAAGPSRPLPGHGPLLPRPRPREAGLPPAGGRGLPRGGGGEGRDTHRQRRAGGRRPRRPAGRPVSVAASLVWERPDGREVVFPLDGEALEVGRDEDVAIRVDEPLVSRRHARLEKRGEAWVVVDLGSTNFTRVNGERVLHERELAHGDELGFGRARCRFSRRGKHPGGFGSRLPILCFYAGSGPASGRARW